MNLKRKIYWLEYNVNLRVDSMFACFLFVFPSLIQKIFFFLTTTYVTESNLSIFEIYTCLYSKEINLNICLSLVI